MSHKNTQAEPTRPIPAAQADCDGNFRATANLSARECHTRALLKIPSSKVIPVIVIPGIMGSNLCATRNPHKAKNKELKPGEAAWRPPNGIPAGIVEASVWSKRTPKVRQKILDAETLDVDDTGDLTGTCDLEVPFDAAVLKQRGWGEIHVSSYGLLLSYLEVHLNKVFRSVRGKAVLDGQMAFLGNSDRKLWRGDGAPDDYGVTEKLTEEELKKFAQYHYPLYAMGYNWLQSNAKSADRLENRIGEIIKFWKDRKQQCNQVILVTHSMGGLVARACAKRIPDKILGVIHGVMPALGAPVCYRRIACGTEPGNIQANYFADIAGSRQDDTTPVMATASGPLELLPNNTYPKPWLHITFETSEGRHSHLSLPGGNVYDLYRDTTSWYRMIDPALADPVKMYSNAGELAQKIKSAITQAENFHTTYLGDYYHPNTYAFYGDDLKHPSFSSCSWQASKSAPPPERAVLGAGTLIMRDARSGRRTVKFADGEAIQFTHSVQDGTGDGTVPRQSGTGPGKGVKYLFCTKGYDHQGSFSNQSMLDLTMQLIVRIALGAK